MKALFKVITIIVLLGSYSYVNAQNYCLQFSKEKKKTLTIAEGKNVSFILLNDSVWNRGELGRITTDSLFIEQKIPKEDMLTERDSNFELIAYGLKDFRMLAYPKTSRIIGTSTIGVLFLVAGMFGGMFPPEMLRNDKTPSAAPYEKEIDFEEGWKVKIIQCK